MLVLSRDGYRLPNRMPDTFGARLRLRREEQRIPLGTIAEQTKIKASLLEALERDDVSQWPCGIFRRAFIRAYAHAINLNPDVVLREFLEVHPEPGEVIATIAANAAASEASRPGGAPTRLRHIVGSAIGSLSRLRRGHSDDHAADPRSPAASAPSSRDVQFAPPTEPAVEIRTLSSAARAEEDRAPDMRAELTVPVAGPGDVDLPRAPGSGSSDAEFELTSEPFVQHGAMDAPPQPDVDLLAVGRLCTELGRVEQPDQVPGLLHEAARVVGAIGLIVWLWDPVPEELRPALAIGYSDRVLDQLPPVRRDADNATAAAFRSAQTCVIGGNAHTSGALAVPLLVGSGCAGVLAMELPSGREQSTSTHAIAMIVAALLAQLVGRSEPADARPAADVRPAAERAVR